MVANSVNLSCQKRFRTMFNVDKRRMFTMPLYYLMVAISFVVPILILVMTTMMDGMVTVDPQTGVETTMKGFENVWQIIGTVSSSEAGMSMDITSMCNINMMFFLIAVFVCIFVADDFRSGYSKNLFTVRARKSDYVISKMTIGFIAGVSMLLAFFFGAMIGGAVSGLSFELGSGVTVSGIICSMLSKIFLVLIFVSIYMIASVFAKQRLWLSIILSLGIGMLFYTMVPIITPINAGILNVIMSFFGGLIFAAGFTYLSILILKKIDLI